VEPRRGCYPDFSRVSPQSCVLPPPPHERKVNPFGELNSSPVRLSKTADGTGRFVVRQAPTDLPWTWSYRRYYRCLLLRWVAIGLQDSSASSSPRRGRKEERATRRGDTPSTLHSICLFWPFVKFDLWAAKVAGAPKVVNSTLKARLQVLSHTTLGLPCSDRERSRTQGGGIYLN